ncbi:MAG: alcohol dehydrogenase catalytic domain-containing protein [bacterium]|nr:alcohol dehydrogenase catalytic domain-containing protein [bacterium]
MRTIILNEPGRFEAIDTNRPTASAGEALVRVHRIGVCGTDLHAFRGKQPFFQYPRVLGHELGVEIVEIGENEFGLKEGDRCAVEPYLNCGHCIACRRGRSNCCVNMKVLGVHLDGGMRDEIAVPIHKLHKSETLTLDQLALVETIGVGAHAVRRAALEAGEYALVIGAGPIGLGAMAMAKAEGARVIALDVNSARLEFCREQIGIEHCVNANDDAPGMLNEITGGDLPTAVFDCTGNPNSMMNALHYMAHGGRLIFVGLFVGDFTFHDPDFHKRETTLLSSRNSTREDMQRVMKRMEDGSLDTRPWITHRAGASEMIERFASWLEPGEGVVKAVVEWQ